MSGIAAMIRFDGSTVTDKQIGAMTAAIRHRGPDGAGHWLEGPVALGHRMLHATCEAQGEAQPLCNEDHSLVLVLDGRLDNRDDLATNLRAKGARLRTPTDAELVLRAYEAWGRECPDRLIGDFAFAIWDNWRKQLYCARDHLGVKPFYYYKSNDFLVVSSEEEGFFGVPEVPREPNDDYVASVFVYGSDELNFQQSSLKGIVKLPPGNFMFVGLTGQQEITTYWRLEAGEDSKFSSDAECEEAFRDLFCQAIRGQLRTNGKPSLMLSGGIDSSSIAGATRSSSLGHAELHTFSVVSDDVATCDETRNIRATSVGHEAFAHTLSFPSFTGNASLDDLQQAAWRHAHPQVSGLLFAGLMYSMAARSGHNIMFDGLDGDLATYAPQYYFTYLMRSGNWRQAWSECKSASIHNTHLRCNRPLKLFGIGAWSVLAPAAVKRLKNRAIPIKFPVYSFTPSLINPDFVREISLVERLRAFMAARPPSYAQTHQQLQVGGMVPAGIARAMEVADRQASLHGVEARHPWADRRLIEFCVRLPLQQRVGDGWSKYLLRRVCRHWLSDDICWHAGKASLGWLTVAHLMATREARDKVATLGNAGLERYLDMPRLRAMCERKNLSSSEQMEIYDVLTVALWLQRLRDGWISLT